MEPHSSKGLGRGRDLRHSAIENRTDSKETKQTGGGENERYIRTRSRRSHIIENESSLHHKIYLPPHNVGPTRAIPP